jgi:hypothetical protein
MPEDISASDQLARRCLLTSKNAARQIDSSDCGSGIEAIDQASP